MESEQRILLNALTNCSRVLVWIVIAAVQTPVLVHALGTERFGAWQLMLSITGFLGFLDLGLGTTLVRFTSRLAARGDLEARNRVASTLFAVYLGLGALGGVLALAILLVGHRSAAASPELAIAFALVALRTPVLLLPGNTLRGLLVGQQLILEANLCQSAFMLAYGVTSIVALRWTSSLAVLAALGLFWMIAEFSVYGALAYRLIPGLELSRRLVDGGLLVELIPFGAKQFAIDVSKIVELKFGVMLVAQLVSLGGAGIYALALRIVEAIHLLVKQGVNVLAPVLSSREGAGDTASVRATFLRGTRYTLVVATLAIVPIAISAPDLLRWWIGDVAVSGALLLRILAFSTWLSLSQSTASVVLAMTGRENAVARCALYSAATNVAASIALWAFLGLPGVACGTLAAVVLVDLRLLAPRALSELEIPWRTFAREALAPAAAAGLVQAAVAGGTIALAGHAFGVVALAHVAGGLAFVAVYLAGFLEPREIAALAGLRPAASPDAAGLRVIQVPRRFVRSSWGGTETLVLQSSRALQRLGHHPAVFTTRALAGADQEVVDGVPVRRFAHFYPYLGLDAARRAALDLKGGNGFSFGLLAALFAEPAVDLIHVHTGKRIGGIARWVARRRGIPYVVTLHGGVYDVPPAERDELAAPTRGALEWGKALGWLVGSRRVLDDAAAIVCVGRREHELVQARHPDRRVVYLPNGVDCERFARGDGPAFRRRYGLPEAAPVVLCVGRLDPQKNQRELVEALPRWRTRFPDLRLVLIGPATDPDYERQLHEAAHARGVADAVTLVGAVEPDAPALSDAYQAADVVVLPSRHEPFGIVVLEAWAAARPVVATRVGGLPGFVRHGEDGLLVEPGDALAAAVEQVLADPALAGRLARAGARRACAEFSWQRAAERLLDLYQEVIHAHPAREREAGLLRGC